MCLHMFCVCFCEFNHLQNNLLPAVALWAVVLIWASIYLVVLIKMKFGTEKLTVVKYVNRYKPSVQCHKHYF